MKKLFTKQEYEQAKSADLLQVQCYICNKIFLKRKSTIKRCILSIGKNCGKYCSKKCSNLTRCNYDQVSAQVSCKQCDKKFNKRNSEISKSENHFCCKSCAATYNNTHKTTGNRRSKLEVWIEQQLSEKYPELEVNYNDKKQIESELDIYFPKFKLACELNGIFHYEPIYGESKFNQIKNNDNRKFQACLEKGIELCIIDTSGLKYFKSDNAKKYLDIIENIIKIKMNEK